MNDESSEARNSAALATSSGLPKRCRGVAHSLATFQRVLVASPAYLKRTSTPRTVSALSEQRAVLGLDSSGAWQFTEGGAARSVPVRSQLRVGTLLAGRAAAIAGLGVAILPDFVVAEALAERTLKALLPACQLAPVSAQALYRVENRGTPRIEALLRHLRATVPLE